MKYVMTELATEAHADAVEGARVNREAGNDVAAKLLDCLARGIQMIDRLTFERNAYHALAAYHLDLGSSSVENVDLAAVVAFDELDEAHPPPHVHAAVHAYHASRPPA